MPTETVQEVHIKPDDIEPAYRAEFERARLGIMRATAPGSPERAEELTTIADIVDMREGWNGESGAESVRQAVIRLLQEARQEAREAGLYYRLSISPEGLITEINILKHLPEDREATARARARMASVPYGRKQNGSSFRKRDVTVHPPTRHPVRVA